MATGTWNLPTATSAITLNLRGMRIECFFLYDGRALVDNATAVRQLFAARMEGSLMDCLRDDPRTADLAASLEEVRFRHGSEGRAGYAPDELARVADAMTARVDSAVSFSRALDIANAAAMLEALARHMMPGLREVVRLAG